MTQSRIFRNGTNTEFNACVGENGWPNIDTYADGFSLATKILAENVLNNSRHVDCIVYPIMFSARHSLELFLKSTIYDIEKIRPELKVDKALITSTHDLANLWCETRKAIEKCDRRYRKYISDFDIIINEFNEIDSKGETFRYPYSKSDDKHLKDQSIINIEVFCNHFYFISELMLEMRNLTKSLIDEYRTRQCTNSLSRNDLKDISLFLPNKELWIHKEFDETKLKIKSNYQIGSQELTEAINLIKNNREFSANIGQIVSLEHISTEVFSDFCEQLRIYNIWQNKTPWPDQLFSADRPNIFQHIKSTYSEQNIRCLYTLMEMGVLDYFSEEYEFLYQQSSLEDIDYLISEIMSPRVVFKRYKKSLKALGQLKLLSILDNYV